MAIWQRTIYIDIGSKNFDVNDVIPLLDSRFKRDWMVESGQCWGDPERNDIFVSWDKETNSITDDIRVRIDLRNLEVEFIQKVIDLTVELGLKLKVIRTDFFEPALPEIFRVLKDSNAHKFTKDTRKFLDDFEKGIIHPE